MNEQKLVALIKSMPVVKNGRRWVVIQLSSGDLKVTRKVNVLSGDEKIVIEKLSTGLEAVNSSQLDRLSEKYKLRRLQKAIGLEQARRQGE